MGDLDNEDVLPSEHFSTTSAVVTVRDEGIPAGSVT